MKLENSLPDEILQTAILDNLLITLLLSTQKLRHFSSVQLTSRRNNRFNTFKTLDYLSPIFTDFHFHLSLKGTAKV